MAQSKYIQSVLDAAGGRPKSTQWYRDKIKEFGKPKHVIYDVKYLLDQAEVDGRL